MTKREDSKSTSWQKVGSWYDKTVGDKGHYYHQHVIFPKMLEMVDFKQIHSLLDLGCGQGVLARQIKSSIEYLGIDLAASLIDYAKKQDRNPKHQFLVKDLTKPIELQKKDYDLATLILALQNIEKPENAIKNGAIHLKKGGLLLIILNHPCFRIPRQSSWEIDQEKKIQYRRIDRYLSEMKIPINMEPSKKNKSSKTWSFHLPLSAYFECLKKNGLAVIDLQEWCSDKVSYGKTSKMENEARLEFPLFLALLAKKI